MKTPFSWLVSMALLAGIHQSAAQGARFFRISGPAATAISALLPDGTLVWTNAQPGATYIFQTASSLSSDSNWVDYVQCTASNNVSTNQLVDFNPPSGMAFIPAGGFTLGDTLDGETDAVPVSVTLSAYFMDTNLVTDGLWLSVYNWATNNGYGFDGIAAGRAPNQPVTTVNWSDILKWCNARSELTGLAPVYYTDMNLSDLYTNGNGTVYANWSANGYRLPTEAEWEKAARGGLIGQRFPWGDTISESQADYQSQPSLWTYDLGPGGYNQNYVQGGLPYTSPVGAFAPNGYGLYDMAGNVFEWCWDWYGTMYEGGYDPLGAPSSTGLYHPIRGGSWEYGPYNARCANRNYCFQEGDSTVVGFRCARGN
jgi:formylglycine-generating enzyme